MNINVSENCKPLVGSESYRSITLKRNIQTAESDDSEYHK